MRNKRITLLYLVTASLPGLAFTYGYNWSFNYTRALREFPSMLAPAPADGRLIETLSFFKNNDFAGNTVIVAHPDYARYVHLAIRNPDPSRLIWARTGSVTNETICRIAESTGAKEVVLVAVKVPDTNTTVYSCLSSIKPVDEEHPWILVARVKESIETSTAMRETLSN
jgi:hypothetical protein